jgi:glycosyltransferase involved in cell wall biosynthesis
MGLIKNKVEVYNYVTSGSSTLPERGGLRKIRDNKECNLKESIFVLRKNGLDAVISIDALPTLSQNDVFILYSHYGDMNRVELSEASTKIIDFSHFYGNKIESALTKRIKPNGYFCEVDLYKYSKLFQEYYGWFKDGFLRRPFAYEERFRCIKNFNDRKNRVCAMGNIARMNNTTEAHRDFVRFYHVFYMQPQRKLFYDKREELKDIMDCYSTIGVDTYHLRKYSEADLIIKREFNWWWNYFVRQRFPKYHRAFDMVETYNDYKIVVNAEDSNGIYAIGAVEAMACGCALIGRDYGVYEDLGYRKDESYIPYDGSIGDFRDKAEYYLRPENQGKLSVIASKGCAYTREHYSEEKVFDEYFFHLIEVTDHEKKD